MNSVITLESSVSSGSANYSVCAMVVDNYQQGQHTGGWDVSLPNNGFTYSEGFTYATAEDPVAMATYCKTIPNRPLAVYTYVSMQLDYFMLFKPGIANKVLSATECFSENTTFEKLR